MFVFVTVPFRGHYNVMDRAAREWIKRGEDVVLVVLTWKNVAAPSIQKTRDDCVYHTDTSLKYSRVVLQADDVPLDDSSPTQFTWNRCEALVDRLYSWCSRQNVLGTIDWIIYDFFCPEALIIANMMRIPSVCSIPAVPGTTWTGFHHSEAKKLRPQLDRISDRYHVRPSLSKRLFPLSDSFYVSGSNRQWLWCHPLIYRRQDYVRSSGFTNITMVSRVSNHEEKKEKNNNTERFEKIVVEETVESQRQKNERNMQNEQDKKELVYVCLGTVVTGNLWDKNINARKCASLVYALVCAWAQKRENRVRVLICAPGLPTDDKLHSIYGKDVLVTHVDQVALLRDSQTSLFVTHGGGNSVAEALDATVPMLVVPFFGDQHVCAKRVERYGFGFSFGRHDSDRAVDTRYAPSDPRLLQAEQFNVLLEHAWSERKNTRDRILRAVPNSNWCNNGNDQEACTRMASTPVLTPVSIDRVTLSSHVVCFERGDLLYGANVARRKFAKTARREGAHALTTCDRLSPFATNGSSSSSSSSKERNDSKTTWELTLCVGKTEPPSSRLCEGAFPALIDHYNDVLRLPFESTVRKHELSLDIQNDDDGADDDGGGTANNDGALTEYCERLRALDRYYQEKHFPSQKGWFKRHSYPPTTLEALWFACCGGLAYFLLERSDTCVHFVVHDDFDSAINKATALELLWLEQHWNDEMSRRVRFYWLRSAKQKGIHHNGSEDDNEEDDTNSSSVFVPCSPVLMGWFRWNRQQIAQTLQPISNWSLPFQKSVLNRVESTLFAAQQEFGALYLQKRIKPVDSMYDKIHVRCKRCAFVDCIGMRIVHLWTENLFSIQSRIVEAVTSGKEFVLVRRRVTERARVIYLYFWNNVARTCLEIQLWPVALHTCLEYEHLSVYKRNICQLSQEERRRSLILRKEEHKLQHLVDQHRLLKSVPKVVNK